MAVCWDIDKSSVGFEVWPCAEFINAKIKTTFDLDVVLSALDYYSVHNRKPWEEITNQRSKDVCCYHLHTHPETISSTCIRRNLKMKALMDLGGVGVDLCF